MSKATGPTLKVVPTMTEDPTDDNSAERIANASLTIPVEQIDINWLTVPLYQEPRSPYIHAARAAACRLQLKKSGGWQDYQCEVLTVFRLKDGTIEVAAGVGRKFMAEESGVTSLPCRVIDASGLKYADRVKIFQRLGTLLYKLTPMQLWRANYGLRAFPEIKAICDVIDNLSNPPKITLQAMQFCHERKIAGSDTPTLERALVAFSNTLFKSNAKLATMHVCAIAAILSIGKVDDKRLRQVFPSLGKDTDQGYITALYNKAVRLSQKEGWLKPHQRTITYYVAQIMVERYNHGLAASKRLHVSNLDFTAKAGKDVYSCESAPHKKS